MVLKLSSTWYLSGRVASTCYQKLGADGLCIHNGTYSVDFKYQVVQFMQEQHLSSYEAAIVFNIPQACTVSKWLRLFKEEGIEHCSVIIEVDSKKD